MKSMIVFALFVAAAVAVPVAVTDSKNAETLFYEFDNIGIDGYNVKFETSDGKSVVENAVLKNVGTENEALEVRGSYSYVGNDGKVYTVTFVANEGGFQPSGAHLPQ